MKPPQPEKLDIKILSPDEAFWQDHLKRAEQEVEICKKVIRYQEAVKEMLEKKISELQKKPEKSH